MKFLTVILMIYLVSSSIFPRTGPGQTWSGNSDDLYGTFVLREDIPLRVSIDTGWERNGRIPVFLSFGGLKVCVRVKAGDLSHALGADTGISDMLTEDMNLPFTTYEQNPLRTRMKLLDKSKPVKLEINRETGRVEVYVGGSRLKLNPIRVRFTPIAPGELVELTFMDRNVHSNRKFVFLPARGIIYAVPRRVRLLDIHPDPGKNKEWTVWAVKIEPGKQGFINRGVIK